MDTTATGTARCQRCGRIRRFRSAAAALKAQPYGRICKARILRAAVNEAVNGFAQAQVDKARELISDGGLIPTGRPGVFRAVSSKGTDTYLVSAKGVCNCPGGLRGATAYRCYHSLGARILVASGKAA